MISLRELTRETWQQCIELKVGQDQQDFVASNLYSLAEAHFYPNTIFHAIYAGETMVGFVMYGPDAEYAPNEAPGVVYALVRLMIAQEYQGHGYGRAALVEVIGRIQAETHAQAIYTSFAPENYRAEKLYRSLSFQRTGQKLEGEIVVRLTLDHG